MRLRSAGAVLLVLGYTALAYWACTQTEPRWWALLPLLIPLVLGLVGAVLGQRVRHAKFGDGVILRLDGIGQGAQVEINFERAGRKTLMLAYANLETL